MKAFSFEEACRDGLKDTMAWYVDFPGLKLYVGERKSAGEYLRSLISRYGPVVIEYPLWHPLAAYREMSRTNQLRMDHTVLFVNAVLSTTYELNEAERTVETVAALNEQIMDADLEATIIEDVTFINRDAYPVLIICEWDCGAGRNADVPTFCDFRQTRIPAHIALPAMLALALSSLSRRRCGRRWDTMASDLLGSPGSVVESVFVNRATAAAMREQYDLLSKFEVFGPMVAEAAGPKRLKQETVDRPASTRKRHGVG